MSGPKCSKAALARQRQEELERKRREEERRRRIEEEERRHRERERAIQKAREGGRASIDDAQRQIKNAIAAGAQRYASSELQRAAELLDEAQSAFRRGDYGRGDFDIAVIHARTAAEEARKVQRITAARIEEERMRREMERKQAEAESTIVAANGIAAHIAELPHDKFAPGSLDEIKRTLQRAKRQLDESDFDSAKSTAERAMRELNELEEKVKRAFSDWQRRKQKAEHALQEAVEAFGSIDQDFTQKWARGMLDELPEQLRELERAIESEKFDDVPDAAESLIRQIKTAVETADENYAKEQKRKVIVRGIRDALGDMGFRAGATLADKDDVTGSVIISANHPSQRKIKMDVDLDTQHIQMNLDDDETTGTHIGADCVADVREIIERLAKQGINMEMTDWGYADPKRVEESGMARQLPREQPRARTA
jgi:hypothetical protein